MPWPSRGSPAGGRGRRPRARRSRSSSRRSPVSRRSCQSVLPGCGSRWMRCCGRSGSARRATAIASSQTPRSPGPVGHGRRSRGRGSGGSAGRPSGSIACTSPSARSELVEVRRALRRRARQQRQQQRRAVARSPRRIGADHRGRRHRAVRRGARAPRLARRPRGPAVAGASQPGRAQRRSSSSWPRRATTAWLASHELSSGRTPVTVLPVTSWTQRARGVGNLDRPRGLTAGHSGGCAGGGDGQPLPPRRRDRRARDVDEDVRAAARAGLRAGACRPCRAGGRPCGGCTARRRRRCSPSVDGPPLERGMTWSTVRFERAPQYWQVQPSRAKTARRVILRRCVSRGTLT